MGEPVLVSFVCAIALVVGLIGTLVPILPGVAFMWLASLLYGFVVGYTPLGIAVMVILTALLVGSVIVGVVLPRKAAVESGATTKSQVVGVIGAIVGFFVIPVVGAIIGALAGVLLAEYADKGELQPAWTATLGTAKGFGMGALAQFGFGFAMLLIWSVWAVTIVF